MSKSRGGIEAAAELLGGLDPASRTKLLANLARLDPTVAAKIEAQLFTFEDLVHVIDREMQVLVREVPPNRLLLALRKASDALKSRVFGAMSPRAAELLRQDLAAQKPQKLSDVQAAQAEVLAIARKLEGQGKILLKKG
jgi:flagellar motor switch protein FliG